MRRAAGRPGRSAGGQASSSSPRALATAWATGHRRSRQAVLEERLGEDTRVTILGHVQRGGAPSAFDRYLGTLLGYAAVRQLLESPGDEPQLIGIRGHHVTPVAADRVRGDDTIDRRRDRRPATAKRRWRCAAAASRESYRLLRTIVQARPRRPEPDQRTLRLAVLHAGGAGAWDEHRGAVAVRVGMDRGHTCWAIRNGFRGLADGGVEEFEWMGVSGWVSRPGAELGTEPVRSRTRRPPSHRRPTGQPSRRWPAADRRLGRLRRGAQARHPRAEHPELAMPIVCVPASINNNLPGIDLSIGADSALEQHRRPTSTRSSTRRSPRTDASSSR